MLRLLNIVNFAVIDRLQVEFNHGLNVLSGETGSGKSILIDALGLLLGDRSSTDFIRTGESRAFIEGVFEIEGNTPLEELLAEAGVDTSEGEALIRRELVANGRGRIFINNQVANVGLLKLIQPHLIDIHGQGDQQSLLLPDAHLNLFDSFAGALKNRARVSQAYDNLQRLARELEPLRRNALNGHPWRDRAGASAESARMPGAQSRWSAGKDLSWEPLRIERVCEVKYDHLQGDRFRHATIFLRWRPDKAPADCRYDQLEVTTPYELAKVFGAGRPQP